MLADAVMTVGAAGEEPLVAGEVKAGFCSVRKEVNVV